MGPTSSSDPSWNEVDMGVMFGSSSGGLDYHATTIMSLPTSTSNTREDKQARPR